MEPELVKSFDEFELDERILKGIARMNWQKPTPAQSAAIPFILSKRDVLLRGSTGSGKTGAVILPILQRIIQAKERTNQRGTMALILAPTQDLCSQILSVFNRLSFKCQLRALNLSTKIDESVQNNLLMGKPSVIVSTPCKMLNHIQKNQAEICKDLELVVIDEADLMFTHGFKNNLYKLLEFLPDVYQTVLVSATLSTDITHFKSVVLQNPVVVKADQVGNALNVTTHSFILAEDVQKATILASFLKLRIINGKILIFVNSDELCYKLKIYLKMFGFQSLALSVNIPTKVRTQVIDEFNRNVCNIMIMSNADTSHEKPEKSSEGLDNDPDEKRQTQENASFTERGIDYNDLSNIINFDFPLTVSSYIHRSGRAGRVTNSGSTLSFVSVKEKSLLDKIQAYFKKLHSSEDDIIKPFKFNAEHIVPLEYRCTEVWRAITKQTIIDIKAAELRNEIFTSEKLHDYFQIYPKDFNALKLKTTHKTVMNMEVTKLPDYIVPNWIQLKQRTQRKYGKKTFTNKKDKGDPLKIKKVDFGKKKKNVI